MIMLARGNTKQRAAHCDYQKIVVSFILCVLYVLLVLRDVWLYIRIQMNFDRGGRTIHTQKKRSRSLQRAWSHTQSQDQSLMCVVDFEV